jgi:hypothetical protein
MSLLNKYAEVNRKALEIQAQADKKLIRAVDTQKVAPQINQSKVNKTPVPPLPKSLYIEAELQNKRSEIARQQQGLPSQSLTPLQRALIVRRSQVEQLLNPDELAQIQMISSDLDADDYVKRVRELPFISQRLPMRIDEDVGAYMNRILNLVAQSSNPDEILKRQMTSEKQELKQKLLRIMDEIEADTILNDKLMTDDNIILLNKSFEAFLKQIQERYTSLDIQTFIQALSFWFSKLIEKSKEPVKQEEQVDSSKPIKSIDTSELTENPSQLILQGNKLILVEGKIKKYWDSQKKDDIKLTATERKRLTDFLSDKYQTTIKYKKDIKNLFESFINRQDEDEEKKEDSGIKRGKGIDNKLVPFGKYMLSLNKLNDNKLYVLSRVGKALTGYPIRMISDEATSFMKDLIQYNRFTHKLFDKLKPIEQRLLQNIITRSDLNKQLGLDIDSTNDKEILNRYLVLMGEYQGGNDSPVVKKELRHIIGHFIKNGKMSKSEGLVHMSELL